MRLIQTRYVDRCPCAPHAIATVLGLPYKKVNSWLYAMGMRKGKAGTRIRSIASRYRVMSTVIRGRKLTLSPMTIKRNLIFMFPEFVTITECKFLRMSVSKFNAMQLPGKFIIETCGHWLCQVDGVVHDVQDCSRKRIKEVWQVL